MSSKGLATRRNIVEKSLQLFSVKGFYNTSINDILGATKLTRGGLYGHFPSKEEIWEAVYDEAARIWREIIFKDIRTIEDPLARLEKVITNTMEDYLGAQVFDGGCFFVNMLVELAGQSPKLSDKILRDFEDFSRLLRSWFEEADLKGLLKPGLNHAETADFIVIAFNGAATLFAAKRNPKIWKRTVSQLSFLIKLIRR